MLGKHDKNHREGSEITAFDQRYFVKFISYIDYSGMQENTDKLLLQLSRKLGQLKSTSSTKKAFVGFDGFVDLVKKAVKQRRTEEIIYYETLTDFADRIKQAAGKSGQIELVTKKVKLGGNAPILSNALGKLGVASYCAGSMGYPKLHAVFSAMNERCKIISLLDPGESQAVEFSDGKLILSELSVFHRYNWNYINNSPEIHQIRRAIVDCSLIAFVDWANLSLASNIWDGVLHDIIKPSGRKDFNFLFDLSDPSKKTVQQVDEVLDLISSFSHYGSVTLGLNENETLRIWCAIHGVDITNPAEKPKVPDVREAGDGIFKAMKIECLLVHPIDKAIAFCKKETIECIGRLVPHPKVLTGGGDNLNAGYCFGLLNGLPIEQCVLLGVAASGAYIQNGESPDVNSIIEYIETWRGELTASPSAVKRRAGRSSLEP